MPRIARAGPGIHLQSAHAPFERLAKLPDSNAPGRGITRSAARRSRRKMGDALARREGQRPVVSGIAVGRRQSAATVSALAGVEQRRGATVSARDLDIGLLQNYRHPDFRFARRDWTGRLVWVAGERCRRGARVSDGLH
jgi:hypothetical protein